MTETEPGPLRKILAFAAAAQAGTGIVLMVAPSVVIPLLMSGSTTDLVIWLGRFLGVALLALGLACWPERYRLEVDTGAFRAMLAYNALIALLFGYVGAGMHLGGPLLWPAAVLHVVIALLLWMRRHGLRSTIQAEAS